ncbi:hypothetical protein CUMW_256690 [Citrus unshiu]|uniref:Cytochrome P450 n=1 Tax=Citrus unshiu TaxID=55188 RepID=A0A2H5QT59_CITUN|nr:hypothetical protein CUMW_256690 [Citrus unshiu]
MPFYLTFSTCPTSATNLIWLPISTPWKHLSKICNIHIFTCQKLDANQDLRRKKIKDLLGYAEEHCRAGIIQLQLQQNGQWQNYSTTQRLYLKDESTRDHAHSFMPKRFLGSEVDFIGRNFESIPFGAGRRICPDLPLDITINSMPMKTCGARKSKIFLLMRKNIVVRVNQ